MADEQVPWGYRGSAAPDVLRILGWLIATSCTAAALLLLLRAQSLGSEGATSGGVYGAAAAVFGAGLVALGTLLGVGATLEHTIAIRAHLDGSVVLRPPVRAGAGAPTVHQQLFDVRLIAAGEDPDAVARELRQWVPAERIPGLMANLPAIVAEGVGHATAQGLAQALTATGATADVSRRDAAD